jgi:hypothetical protein
MSRKPKTQREMTAEEDRTDIPHPTDRPTGRRFVSGEVLAIERELVTDGVDLPNRGIPIAYRDKASKADADELRAAIDLEVEKEHPNQSLIGWLNEHLPGVSD